MNREYFDTLAAQMKQESNDSLAQRVKDGISVTLPGDWHPDATQTRMPTERQLHEAYVAAQELERRAGGAPEPVKTYEESWTMTDADLQRFVVYPSDETMREQYHPRHHPKVGVITTAEPGTMAEPEWWVRDDGSASVRHPLTTQEEVEVELPTEATLKELEEKILLGMPSRGDEGIWHVPDAKELAEAKAALKVLVKRADG